MALNRFAALFSDGGWFCSFTNFRWWLKSGCRVVRGWCGESMEWLWKHWTQSSIIHLVPEWGCFYLHFNLIFYFHSSRPLPFNANNSSSSRLVTLPHQREDLWRVLFLVQQPATECDLEWHNKWTGFNCFGGGSGTSFSKRPLFRGISSSWWWIIRP